jgi:hypothetical protein
MSAVSHNASPKRPIKIMSQEKPPPMQHVGLFGNGMLLAYNKELQNFEECRCCPPLKTHNTHFPRSVSQHVVGFACSAANKTGGLPFDFFFLTKQN